MRVPARPRPQIHRIFAPPVCRPTALEPHSQPTVPIFPARPSRRKGRRRADSRAPGPLSRKVRIWRLAALGLGLILLAYGAWRWGQAWVKRQAKRRGLALTEVSHRGLHGQTWRKKLPHGLGHLHAINIDLHWWPGPIVANIEQLDWELASTQPTATSPKARGYAKAKRKTSSEQQSEPAWSTRDWHLSIARGPSVDLGGSLRAGLSDIEVTHTAAPNERLTLRALATLADQEPTAVLCEVHTPMSLQNLQVRCRATHEDAPWFGLRVTRRGDQIGVHITRDEQPTLELQYHRSTKAISLDGHAIALDQAVALAKILDVSLPAPIQLAPWATMSGRLKISPPKGKAGLRTLELFDLSVQGLGLAHPKLAPEPLEFGPMRLSGSFAFSYRRKETPWGELDLNLDGLATRVAWHLEPEHRSIRLQAPAQDCNRWIEALPQAMRTQLEGMRLEGQSPGLVELDYEPAKLAALSPDDPIDSAGSLLVDWPFFSVCKVLQEPAPLAHPPHLTSRYLHHWQGQDKDLAPRFMGPKSRQFLALSRMPQFARAMTVTEDPNFWDHDGFDRELMRQAVWYDLAKGKVARGASTISQQCARMLWLGTHRDLARKIQEIILTWRLEAHLSKSRILELYLNLIELGPKIHGGKDAARFYFGQPLSELNLKEKLFLATLAPAPSARAVASQYGSISKKWSDNLLQQIERLRIRGWVSTEDAQDANEAPLRLRRRARAKRRRR